MSDAVEEKGVNNDGVDNRMDDADAGIGSPADEMETHNLDIDDYDKIIENANKSEEEEASGETEKTDESTEDDSEGSSEKEEEEEKARVPKSRLDEVIGQRKQYEEDLATERAERARERAYFEGRLHALEQSLKPEANEEPQTSPFENLLSGEPQEILDALQENPAEFFSNLQAASHAKAQAELRAEQEEQKYYADLRQGLDAFAADHDGFMENIQKMGEVVDSNPIHNLVSAFAYEVEIPAMKKAHEEALASAKGDLEAAKAEGIKIGKAEALKEFKAKGAAAVLDGSQLTQGGKVSGDPELHDTEKSGGLRKVIIDNLLKRRAAKGA